MAKTLSEFLPALCDTAAERAECASLGGIEVTGVACDSRLVKPGCIFVAIKGNDVDGHRYVPHAVRAGARVIVAQRLIEVPRGVQLFVCPDARRRLAELAAMLHDRPGHRLNVVGITGTNGKTTTAFRTRSVLEHAGHPTGLIGTVGYVIGERHIPAQRTTPDAPMFQALLAEMVDAGCTHAVAEISSHALDQQRVASVAFDVAVFTCISGREHLDYHPSFEAYLGAKGRLFELLAPSGTAVINRDDKNHRTIAARVPRGRRTLFFGMQEPAQVRAEVQSMDLGGTEYRLHTPSGTRTVRTRMLGGFNVQNELACAAAALASGVDLDDIVGGIESAEPVPGRLERIPAPGFHALVDYAHNEGGLDAVLSTVRGLAPKRLIVVFGCGGNRDRSKRPAMGVVAQKHAHLVILTADNSRHEPTDRILREIQMDMKSKPPRLVEPDRARAIAAGVEAARPGDVVLVCGKGHEQTQEIGPTKTPFDDREVLRRAIAALGARRRAAELETTHA
jgi:UDP-N-acetylmuramoyl-L-alanyl-D-glutamate--2,6-diaminopimelate ligase